MRTRWMGPAALALVAFAAPVVATITPVSPRTPGARAPLPDVIDEMSAAATSGGVQTADSGSPPDIAVDLKVLLRDQIASVETELQGVLLRPGTTEVVGNFVVFVRRLINRDLASGDVLYAEWHLEFFDRGSIELSGAFPGLVRGRLGAWQAIVGATGDFPRSGQAAVVGGIPDIFVRLGMFFDPS